MHVSLLSYPFTHISQVFSQRETDGFIWYELILVRQGVMMAFGNPTGWECCYFAQFCYEYSVHVHSRIFNTWSWCESRFSKIFYNVINVHYHTLYHRDNWIFVVRASADMHDLSYGALARGCDNSETNIQDIGKQCSSDKLTVEIIILCQFFNMSGDTLDACIFFVRSKVCWWFRIVEC